MAETLRILHYINQFYGGIGGEDKASVGLSAKDGPVGPGMLMKAVLAGRGEIVKTVICGDNYISEHQAEVIPQILDIIREVKPDLVLAGPGFNAGRYGIACAALTAAVQEQLKIPCATALFSENPGTDLYKNRCYIVQTDNNAKNMKDAMSRLVEFGIKLANGETIAVSRARKKQMLEALQSFFISGGGGVINDYFNQFVGVAELCGCGVDSRAARRLSPAQATIFRSRKHNFVPCALSCQRRAAADGQKVC